MGAVWEGMRQLTGVGSTISTRYRPHSAAAVVAAAQQEGAGVLGATGGRSLASKHPVATPWRWRKA